MSDPILDFRLFRYALASAEYGSFRRAAAALNIQQSTVSRGIRKLEYRVGAELFERGHAGIRPTEAGERFLKEATLGFDHMKRAMHRAAALQRGEHGALIIGASVPLASLGDVFERFRKTYGGVSVEVIEGTTSGGLASIQQRMVDVAFVARMRCHGAAQSLHLRDQPMIAVLPKAHRLAGSRSLALEDISRERFILSESGLGPDIAEHLEHKMAKWDVRPIVQLHRISQCNLLTLVARGFGLTIVVGPLSPATLDDVALVPLVGRNVISVCAMWMESNPNPAVRGLQDILRKSVLPRATG